MSVRVHKKTGQVAALAGKFNFIIDAFSAEHDYNTYLSMPDTDGVMICVGASPTPSQMMAFSLTGGRRSLASSLIGGLPTGMSAGTSMPLSNLTHVLQEMVSNQNTCWM